MLNFFKFLREIRLARPRKLDSAYTAAYPDRITFGTGPIILDAFLSFYTSFFFFFLSGEVCSFMQLDN